MALASKCSSLPPRQIPLLHAETERERERKRQPPYQQAAAAGREKAGMATSSSGDDSPLTTYLMPPSYPEASKPYKICSLPPHPLDLRN
jgi:hypothetical protein